MATIRVTTNNDTQMELKCFLPNAITGNFTNVLQNCIARDAIQVPSSKNKWHRTDENVPEILSGISHFI
jgi:hypothetical protein